MRTFFIFFLLIFFIFSCKDSNSSNGDDENNSEYDIAGWELVWQDEFNDDIIDPFKWEHEVNADGGGNNELQYYTARTENSYIADSVLVIKAIKETYSSNGETREYTSARMRTKNKGDWLYGRFDIRAKLPQGQGIWPAIWMLPTDWEYGGWAASGEIDIMELVGHQPHIVYGTIHYGGTYPDNLQTGTAYTLPSGIFADDFHLFTLIWKEGEMQWYVDGNHFLTITEWTSINGEFPAPFNKRFHLLLNVAVGGNWPGDPDVTTLFPQTMEINYVRVYKKAE